MIKSLDFFIIDDDEDDKELLCEVISELYESHTCITAANGQEALQLLQKSNKLSDFIFLDLNMPRMNGKQCLVQLKTNEKFAAISVIIYSTSSNAAHKEETRELGAAYFITKPSCMQELKNELELFFKKYYEKVYSI